ncbi:MAG: hypothetical protein NT027_17030 [Proteobacteria bacterium]|nr:hypothetical protein [Pseudomonadota bacterium]
MFKEHEKSLSLIQKIIFRVIVFIVSLLFLLNLGLSFGMAKDLPGTYVNENVIGLYVAARFFNPWLLLFANRKSAIVNLKGRPAYFVILLTTSIVGLQFYAGVYNLKNLLLLCIETSPIAVLLLTLKYGFLEDRNGNKVDCPQL